MDWKEALQIVQVLATLVLLPILRYARRICREIDDAADEITLIKNEAKHIKDDVQELRGDVRSVERRMIAK